MAVLADARILLALARGLPKRQRHADALAGFYGPQAERYDDFRERLLYGRRELIDVLPVRPGDHVVELGGGTGQTLEYFGPRLAGFERIEVVDLCRPLLEIAARRTAHLPNVRIVEGDAVTYQPGRVVDCVYFSYALTMIPAWRDAIDNAVRMLRPGGSLGIVDFYVSSRSPDPGLRRHGWVTRHVWPAWFRHDGVHLSDAHLPYARTRVETLVLREGRSPLPYVPWATVPYYLFVGRKPAPAA